MEKNHVVIDMDTFFKLKKDSDELKDLKESKLILSKDTFQLEKDYFGDKVLLKVDGKTITGIAETLFDDSEFKGEYFKKFSNEDLKDTIPIDEYYLYFEQIKEEIQESESEENANE